MDGVLENDDDWDFEVVVGLNEVERSGVRRRFRLRTL